MTHLVNYRDSLHNLPLFFVSLVKFLKILNIFNLDIFKKIKILTSATYNLIYSTIIFLCSEAEMDARTILFCGNCYVPWVVFESYFENQIDGVDL